MKIAIIGLGYVGNAMYNFFRDHYDVIFFDPGKEGSANRVQINECDLGVVCVPTPMANDKSCDLSIVEETIGWLDTPLILLKSTVELGTTERLKKKTGKRIVFSPEYCGESTYWSPYDFHTDVKETPFFIFGGDEKDASKMIDFFMPVVGPTKRYVKTDATSAELAKYMENSFYATKITFCYEMKNICDALGSDYNEVRELFLLDPRVNPMHTSVFHENHLPFSGKCLPKDINALACAAEKNGYSAELLKEVWKSNLRIGEMRGNNE